MNDTTEMVETKADLIVHRLDDGMFAVGVMWDEEQYLAAQLMQVFNVPENDFGRPENIEEAARCAREQRFACLEAIANAAKTLYRAYHLPGHGSDRRPFYWEALLDAFDALDDLGEE